MSAAPALDTTSSQAGEASAASAASAVPAIAAASGAATAAAAAAAASAPAPVAPATLPAADNLTKLMVEKSISMLLSHKAVSSRGPGIFQRNLNGIFFGPMYAQSWENQLMQAEQRTGKLAIGRVNEASLARLKTFFTSKKMRSTSGAAIAVALINPAAKAESFEHRLTLLWLGGAAAPRLFKVDGMKRDGVKGLTREQTTWPMALTEVPKQGEDLWAALQAFVAPPANAKQVGDWTAAKAAAWDTIVAQHSATGSVTPSTPFGTALELKGGQTFCVVASDEEGLAISTKNGLIERLKAISQQLDAMEQ